MSGATLLEALALPPEVRVDRRVAKKLLLEQGAPTAADKRIIQDGVDDLYWIAALKPSNIGVPAFRDSTCDYGEIAVLTVALRSSAKARLTELIHRAIPYPVLLISAQGDVVYCSLVHKRFSQGKAGKVVLDGDVVSERLLSGNGVEADFLAAMALSRQRAKDLRDLYQGWMERLVALTTARITGIYGVSASDEGNRDRREALQAHKGLTKQLAALHTLAAKEKQLNRRVELNLEISRLEKSLNDVYSRL
ncbi:MAG: DUF4391 domain-containing protein [Magnetococcales bacterium]|nr:DUF4391 domain-containing protein [Magnetococcales bacterium]